MNKYAVWIPIEGDMNFYWMDKCQSYIGFTNITPQPHYYRPNGMSYADLVTFMQNCKNRGWGVEFECDNAVLGESENCGCGVGTDCVMRARNYYCAAREVGGFTYIYHYFSNSIGNYRAVKNFDENTCPPGGFDTC